MICPKCKSNQVSVINSRRCNEGVNRRRSCLACGFRFTTLEISIKDYEALREKEQSLQEALRRVKKVIDDATS